MIRGIAFAALLLAFPAQAADTAHGKDVFEACNRVVEFADIP